MKHLLLGILLSIFAVFALYSWKAAVVIAFWFFVIRFVISRSARPQEDVAWTPDAHLPDPSDPVSTGVCDQAGDYGCDSSSSPDQT